MRQNRTFERTPSRLAARCSGALFAGAVGLLCAGAGLAAQASVSVQRSFSDYQTILDRMPFGQPPPPAPAVSPDAAAPTDAQTLAEQQKLAKQVNMSCVNVTPDGGTAIGFTDLSDKTPVNYYLLVGASAGGWTVVSADYDEEWAQIAKEGVTITLKLGKGLIDAPPKHHPVAVAEDPGQGPEAGAKEPAPSGFAAMQPDANGNILGLPASMFPNARPEPGVDYGVPDPKKVKEDPNYRPLPSGMRGVNRMLAAAEDAGDKSYAQQLRERQALLKKRADENSAYEAMKAQLVAKEVVKEEFDAKLRSMALEQIKRGEDPMVNVELTDAEEKDLRASGVLQ